MRSPRSCTRWAGFKRAGLELRPELQTKHEAAAQWLRDCLNAEKRDRLSPDQVLYLLRRAREINFHAAKYWFDSELGYQQGPPIAPRDELATLLHRQEQLPPGRSHRAPHQASAAVAQERGLKIFLPFASTIGDTL